MRPTKGKRQLFLRLVSPTRSLRLTALVICSFAFLDQVSKDVKRKTLNCTRKLRKGGQNVLSKNGKLGRKVSLDISSFHHDMGVPRLLLELANKFTNLIDFVRLNVFLGKGAHIAHTILI